MFPLQRYRKVENLVDLEQTFFGVGPGGVTQYREEEGTPYGRKEGLPLLKYTSVEKIGSTHPPTPSFFQRLDYNCKLKSFHKEPVGLNEAIQT